MSFCLTPGERWPQRLIDTSNINLNGLIYPEGLKSFLKLVLDKQKTLGVEIAHHNTAHMDDERGDDPYGR